MVGGVVQLAVLVLESHLTDTRNSGEFSVCVVVCVCVCVSGSYLVAGELCSELRLSRLSVQVFVDNLLHPELLQTVGDVVEGVLIRENSQGLTHTHTRTQLAHHIC